MEREKSSDVGPAVQESWRGVQVKSFSISFYFISGVMLGIEMQRRLDTDSPVLVIDLLIVRFMFEVENEDDE